ncbi:hypothetical protein OSB04_029354 [Centaurea solstitialis]|uniref:Tf2-1-like SH3-like domain-containing protein n=1 Tax=Centaurea solstitialis TaxID=347529 RepID=A0AA38SI88_9ASTR|nr:hypothetical protein OSB04_029354 [Centaurea solstitialis]
MRYFTGGSVGHHRAIMRLARINLSGRELFRFLLMRSTRCDSEQRHLEGGKRYLPGRECYVLAKNKLNPPYIGPFEIVERLDQVAFRLDLLVETRRMRNTCHVTNLMACLAESELQAKYMRSGADKAELSSVEAETGKDRVVRGKEKLST